MQVCDGRIAQFIEVMWKNLGRKSHGNTFYPPSVAPAAAARSAAAASAAAASAAAPSVEWAAAAATAAAVAAAVKNTKTRRTAVGGMPAAVLFLGFRREGNSFDKSTLLTYTEKHA